MESIENKHVLSEYTLVLIYRIKLIRNLVFLGFEFSHCKSYNGIVDLI